VPGQVVGVSEEVERAMHFLEILLLRPPELSCADRTPPAATASLIPPSERTAHAGGSEAVAGVGVCLVAAVWLVLLFPKLLTPLLLE